MKKSLPDFFFPAYKYEKVTIYRAKFTFYKKRVTEKAFQGLLQVKSLFKDILAYLINRVAKDELGRYRFHHLWEYQKTSRGSGEPLRPKIFWIAVGEHL